MRTERYLFSRMTPEARTELVEEIVQWGLTIWHGSAEDFRAYWLDVRPYKTIVNMLREDDGKMVGTTTLKYYDDHYDGHDVIIAKLALGLDPVHRGTKFALRCLIRELLHLKLNHPFKKIYLFATLVHPVVYKLCCDVLSDRMYPYYKSPENAEAQRMVDHLAEMFHLQKAESPHPFVYRDRFWTRETAQVSEYWRANPRPEVQFYVQHCPAYYCSRDCLIALSPIRLTHVLPLMLRTLVRTHLDRRRRRKARLAEARPAGAVRAAAEARAATAPEAGAGG